MPIIHLQWDGPFTLEQTLKMNNDYDYGVYQVYGSHPIYGSDVILYIGRARDQTFSSRIGQEEWRYNQDAQNVRYYVGRLAGEQTPEDDELGHQIDMVEALLIHSHWPAGNAQYIKSLGANATDLTHIHILNWGHRRDLLSEVSGLMMTDHFDTIPNYHCYDDGNNTLGV